MKSLLLLFASLLMAAGAAAADTPHRSSISVLLVKRPAGSQGAYDSRILSHFATLDLGDKYDINPLSTRILDMSGQREYADYSTQQRAVAIGKEVEAQDFSKEIVSFWYNRKADGSMDLSRIFERGMYSATDQDYRQAIATVRGVRELQDAGLWLIGHSYLLVLDVSDVKPQHDNLTCCYAGSVDAYLYRLDYNQAKQDAIFESWIDEDTRTFEVAKRKKAFDRLNFNLRLMHSVRLGVQTNETATSLLTVFLAPIVLLKGKIRQGEPCSDEGELAELTAGAFTQAMRELENKQADIKAKTSVLSTLPITAKIGKKEGLKRNQLFEVYEYYADDDQQQVRERRVALVRATAVADNRHVADGNMQTSNFTPIAGKKPIRKGMMLKQLNDDRFEFGIDFSVGLKKYPHGTDIDGSPQTIRPMALNILSIEIVDFYLTGGISGRTLFDISSHQFNGEKSVAGTSENFVRIGYSLGYNITPSVSVHGFSKVGCHFSFSTAIFSYGATVNFSYFYPHNIYLKMESTTINFDGLPYPAMGFGYKYAF